jgi:uncharacterized membrane protein YfcA
MMRKLILLGLVGLAAQLVDGGLGMAYGVTTSTLLLFIGTNPAAASATVHLAEIGTTFVSGASHWKFGNVDWHVVVKVGVPGAIGAFLGATALSNLDADVAKPVMSSILLVLGLYVLTRFTFKGIRTDRMGQRLRARFLAPLGSVRRLHRRHRGRRVGSGRHSGPAGERADRAAACHRQHLGERVPGHRCGQPRLPGQPRI